MMGSAAMSDTPMTFDPAAIQRAAADLPTSVLNTLQQVTGQHTPYQPFQVRTQPVSSTQLSADLPPGGLGWHARGRFEAWWAEVK